MFSYKRASVEDIPLLIENRVRLLKLANNLKNISDWSSMKKELYHYYICSIPSNNHIAYLAYKESVFVGTGGICFYHVLPTYHNPTGRKAYITNMYTLPEFRNQGVASCILNYLIEESLDLGVKFISLEATESARKIYKKIGFTPLYTEMQLKNETYDMNQNKIH